WPTKHWSNSTSRVSGRVTLQADGAARPPRRSCRRRTRPSSRASWRRDRGSSRG
ncbi:MAG: hypothetical protein AVDCRST_MAG39-1215, partial [uncultured Sphingomonadaceae bacterium]